MLFFDLTWGTNQKSNFNIITQIPSLRTADAFRSSLRKCVCCSQANQYHISMFSILFSSKKSMAVLFRLFFATAACSVKEMFESWKPPYHKTILILFYLSIFSSISSIFRTLDFLVVVYLLCYGQGPSKMIYFHHIVIELIRNNWRRPVS